MLLGLILIVVAMAFVYWMGYREGVEDAFDAFEEVLDEEIEKLENNEKGID